MRDDVIKWKHFPRYWPFVRGIHRSPVNSPHKGQWRGALMFSLIYARIKNKRLSTHSRGWWFETLSCSLWRHRNEVASEVRHGWVSSEFYVLWPRSSLYQIAACRQLYDRVLLEPTVPVSTILFDYIVRKHDDVIKWMCGEFTGQRCIPRTKASDAELLCFSLICVWINSWVNNREAGDLRRYRAHYDVTVMKWRECCPSFSALFIFRSH